MHGVFGALASGFLAAQPISVNALKLDIYPFQLLA